MTPCASCGGLGYTGAGTVEFLVKDGEHYFMEVNARVQVEHPVSEMVTGVDIIRQQILAASDESLEITQAGCPPGRVRGGVPHQRALGGQGHPVHEPRRFRRADGHLPLPGLPGAAVVRSPGGKAHRDGPHPGRRACAGWSGRSSELVIEGIATNIESQKKIVAHPVFRKGDYGTGFLGEILKEGGL